MTRDPGQGTLPADVLEYVFRELRQDDLAHWDEHRCFPDNQRTLCACALVSRSWRDLVLGHLFRDLVFTHGQVIDQECEDSRHPATCIFCNCSCHWEESERDRRTVPDLLKFLQNSPHVRAVVRTLRLRISPLSNTWWSPTSKDAIDLASLLELLAYLPRLASIHLEDITLSGALPSIESPRLSVEELTFGRCLPGDFSDTVQCIVRNFRYIGCLRFPSSLNGMSLNFQTRVGSVGFHEDSYHEGESIFALISKAESGPRSLDVTGLPAGEDARLQVLLNSIGDRLHHFCYVYRTPVFMGVLMTPPPSQTSIPFMDLSRCTNLQTFYTSIHFGSLGEDFHSTICPMLRTLKAGSPKTLTQVVITAWALPKSASSLGEDATRLALSELEDIILTLRHDRGLSDFVFRLLYEPTTEHLPVECAAALQDALPRLTKAGVLRVVSKDADSVANPSNRSLKQATQRSGVAMSLVSEPVPPPAATGLYS